LSAQAALATSGALQKNVNYADICQTLRILWPTL
jgi:hypothetical protein